MEFAVDMPSYPRVDAALTLLGMQRNPTPVFPIHDVQMNDVLDMVIYEAATIINRFIRRMLYDRRHGGPNWSMNIWRDDKFATYRFLCVKEDEVSVINSHIPDPIDECFLNDDLNIVTSPYRSFFDVVMPVPLDAPYVPGWCSFDEAALARGMYMTD